MYTWMDEHAVIWVVAKSRSFKVQRHSFCGRNWDCPRNITVDCKNGPPILNLYAAFTGLVIGLYWIQWSKTDTGTLCGCQRTATGGSWGIVGKETIQDNSTGRDACLVAKGGHCENKILSYRAPHENAGGPTVSTLSVRPSVPSNLSVNTFVVRL